MKSKSCIQSLTYNVWVCFTLVFLVSVLCTSCAGLMNQLFGMDTVTGGDDSLSWRYDTTDRTLTVTSLPSGILYLTGNLSDDMRQRIRTVDFDDDVVVNTIDFNAFKHFTGLRYMTIPSTVTSVRSNAFDGCHLSKLTYDPLCASSWDSDWDAGLTCDDFKVPNYIGYIYYGSDTWSKDYNSGETLIGIVCAVDTRGYPSKILSLSEDNYIWSNSGAGGYINFETSDIDGSGNLDKIREKDSVNWNNNNVYPAFSWCNSITLGGYSWYLPAIDELTSVMHNHEKINEALQKLSDAGLSTSIISSQFYWSSSQDRTDDGRAKCASINASVQFIPKSTSAGVRVIAKIK